MIVYHVTYDLCRNTAGVNWVCLIHGLSGLIKWDFCLFTFMVMWLLLVSFLIFISGSHQPHHGTLSGLMIQHEEAWPPNPPPPCLHLNCPISSNPQTYTPFLGWCYDHVHGQGPIWCFLFVLVSIDAFEVTSTLLNICRPWMHHQTYDLLVEQLCPLVSEPFNLF